MGRACNGNGVEKRHVSKKRNTGKTSLPDEESARVVAEIRKYFDAECAGNMTALARWLDVSRTSAQYLYDGTNKPGITTAMTVAERIGKPWVELLSGLPFMDLKKAAERIVLLEEQVSVLTSALRRLEDENATVTAANKPFSDPNEAARIVESGRPRLVPSDRPRHYAPVKKIKRNS